MTDEIKLRPAYLVYPGLYPLLMMNYWVRKNKTPIVAILISDFDIKYRGKYLNLFETVFGLAQHAGWRYTFYMLFVSKFAVPIVKMWGNLRRLLGKEIKIKTFDQIAVERGIPVFRTRDFNGDAAVQFLKNVGATIIVSAYNNQILKRKIFGLPQYKSLNIHAALLPDFRGLDPTFEALYQGVKQTGVTVHYIDGKIDTGAILAQEPVKVRASDTLFSLSVRTWFHGAKILEKVFDSIRAGNVVAKRQSPKDIRFSYQSYPSKQRVKELLAKGRKILTWSDVKNTFRD